MTDDQPLDLTAVAADDAALEALRTGAGDDPALALLRDLLLDVERDLPTPVLRSTTIVAFAAADPERRFARNGTVVAALTAGLLSLGGVAAASTLAPVDSPLHGLGEAVRSAAGAVVGAVSPPASPARSAAVVPTTTASPTTAAVAVAAPTRPTPGATVSAASRSRAAARQVDQLLDDAAALLTAGRTTAAVSRLDLAERKLAQVLVADRADLPERLAALRAQATSASPKATRTPKPAPAKTKAATPQGETPRGGARTGRPEDEPAAEPKGDKARGKSLRGQLSSDASMKPRA